MTEIFQFLSQENDVQWLFLDGSIVKAHQDSTNISSQAEQAIGKSRGGKSTKIHLAVDSGGLPVHFEVSGGQVHDISYGESLVLSSPDVEVVVADKGYDSQALRELIKSRNAKHVIPRKGNSKQGNNDIDWCMYRYHCGVVYAKSIKNNLSGEELYGIKISNINGEARLSNSYRYKLKSGFNYMKLSDLVFSEVDEYNRKPYTANPVNDVKLRKARNKRPRKDVAVYLPAGYSYSFAAKLLRDLSSKQIHSRYWYPTIHKIEKLGTCS